MDGEASIGIAEVRAANRAKRVVVGRRNARILIGTVGKENEIAMAKDDLFR